MSDNNKIRNSVKEISREITPERVQRDQQAYADMVAKYYGDPDFKAEVNADPTKAFKEAGFEIPEGAKVVLLFNTEEYSHVILPRPFEED